MILNSPEYFEDCVASTREESVGDGVVVKIKKGIFRREKSALDRLKLVMT